MQKEQVLIEASMRGFSETETNALINDLIRDGIIFESSPGYLKKR